LHVPPPPTPTLFPYTTLFRSLAFLHLPHRHQRDETRGQHVEQDEQEKRAQRDEQFGQARVVNAPVEGHALVTQRERDDGVAFSRSEEHTSELQSRENLVCRLL